MNDWKFRERMTAILTVVGIVLSAMYTEDPVVRLMFGVVIGVCGFLCGMACAENMIFEKERLD